MAFGNGSTTVPSTRIVSSFGLAREHHLQVWSAPADFVFRAAVGGPIGQGADRRDYLIRRAIAKRAGSGSGADRMGGAARATQNQGAAAEPTVWEAQRERPRIRERQRSRPYGRRSASDQ